MALPRFAPDHFTLALVGTVVLASLLPASGPMARVLEVATTGVVSLLFFLHGAKLSRQAILGGLGHWR
ncbi:MAG: bile acid:sodium symporter, partial [Alicycliphilus sp.]|nr:bile acid:sodium symporter [Alicycliphilus sp.]